MSTIELLLSITFLLLLNIIALNFNTYEYCINKNLIYIKIRLFGIYLYPISMQINIDRITSIQASEAFDLLSIIYYWFKPALVFSEKGIPKLKIKCKFLTYYITPIDNKNFIEELIKINTNIQIIKSTNMFENNK